MPGWRRFRPDFDLLLLPHFLGESVPVALHREQRGLEVRGALKRVVALRRALERGGRARREHGVTPVEHVDSRGHSGRKR